LNNARVHEEIIEGIKEFCYNFDESYPNTHEFFQISLMQLLRSKGCLVNIKHEIFFDCVKVNGDIVRRRGFTDLLVFFKGKKIAIEFDKGNKLKLKSISKLLQIDADTRIGIVRGNQKFNVWWTNKNRIAYIMRRLRILKKPILLIINSQKSASWIYPMF
jgi:hypothetical protein